MMMPPAIWAARGSTLSVSKASIRNSCMPPTCSMGKMATAMTMMPTPPSHWRIARHSRIPGGASSRPTMMVAPVVVTPDMDSKKASVTLSSSSEKAKGKAPKTAITSQARLVMTKAWRSEKLVQPERAVRIIETPTKSDVPAEAVKTCQSGWPTSASTTAGIAMATASTHSRIPRMKTTGRNSIMPNFNHGRPQYQYEATLV